MIVDAVRNFPLLKIGQILGSLVERQIRKIVVPGVFFQIATHLRRGEIRATGVAPIVSDVRHYTYQQCSQKHNQKDGCKREFKEAGELHFRHRVSNVGNESKRRTIPARRSRASSTKIAWSIEFSCSKRNSRGERKQRIARPHRPRISAAASPAAPPQPCGIVPGRT
ncbi:hypothetical protein Bmul_1578 [Burkholderia multivorans ATCC 17616]|nr:hypothetical protein Bmul_1578 [Burkholderia multivorans ATCC 17616]